MDQYLSIFDVSPDDVGAMTYEVVDGAKQVVVNIGTDVRVYGDVETLRQVAIALLGAIEFAAADKMARS